MSTSCRRTPWPGNHGEEGDQRTSFASCSVRRSARLEACQEPCLVKQETRRLKEFGAAWFPPGPSGNSSSCSPLGTPRGTRDCLESHRGKDLKALLDPDGRPRTKNPDLVRPDHDED